MANSSATKNVLDELRKLAAAAREQREAVPLASVAVSPTVPQKVIIERYARDCGGQDAEKGFHFWFGDRTMLRDYADQGHEPVVRPGSSEIENYQGDPLLKIPTWMYRDSLKAAKIRSDRMIANQSDLDKAKAAKNPASSGEEVSVHKPGSRGWADAHLEAGVPV